MLRRCLPLLTVSATLACSPDSSSVDTGSSTLSGSSGGDEAGESTTDTDGGTGETGSTEGTSTSTDTDTGAGEVCECAPGTDLIYLASKWGEVYSYDPLVDSFAEIGEISCGSGLVYSMAVDQQNRGWILDLDSQDVFTIDLNDPTNCTEPPWVPGNGGFSYWGMGFVSDDTMGVCEKLYLHSYSGDGAFDEEPGSGKLAVYDPADGSLETLATLDFDGGEIDGTGDGRLFAFAGEGPTKLVEYDRLTGEQLEVFPLDGLEKTSASAFAFHSGDFYFFTEAIPPDCVPCLDACTPSYQACMDDPVCAESFECALTTGELSDDCGGLAPQELHDCLTNTCLEACFPQGGRVSEVTRLDWDESEGNGKALELVNEAAPIRVVGAGTSICAPLEVP